MEVCEHAGRIDRCGDCWVATAPVAPADSDDDRCGLAVTLFCRFLPIAPELDGDVDLTKQLPPAPPTPTMPGDFHVPR